MASFFKNLFRKDDDSQPVPAAPLTNGLSGQGRGLLFQEIGGNAPGSGVPSGRTGPSAGPGGPFSAVSGRHMTAREVASLLPPELLRTDGISPDQPVPLPVAALRESMNAGRPVLKLSQIHAACPALFQRALLPDEDGEVTLPLARVKGILEFSAPMNPLSDAPSPPLPASGSPFPSAAGNPFAAINSASPFAAAASPFAPAAGAEGQGNPFAQPRNPLPAAAPAPLRNEAPSPFPTAAATPGPIGLSPTTPSAHLSVSPSPSPFAAAPPAAAVPLGAPSPFAPAHPMAANPGPPAAANSPFAAALPPTLPPGPATSPFARVLPETAPPPADLIAPAAAVSTSTLPASLSPTPFSPIAPPAALPPVSPFNQIPASPAAPAPAPLSWPPPAVPAQTSGPPPLQPRPMALPGARTAPVPATAPSAPVSPPPPLAASTGVAPGLALPVGAPAPRVGPSASQPVPPGMVDLSLRAALRDADPSDLGFVAENVPESVRVVLPVDLVSRQLASGRVEVGVEDLCAGIAEKFRPAFARAKAGLRIVIPMSEVFHNLPDTARPALEPAPPVDFHRSITTSPFQTPFAIKAEEDSNRQLLDPNVPGFSAASRAAHPVTHPVPAAVLPPAPLPPVQPSAGAPPAVQVELPPLRPAPHAAAPSVPPAVVEGEAPPLTPRLGLFSRPPGSGTAPTEAPVMPKSPPRIKSVPASPTAQRAFPKPPSPPAAPGNDQEAPAAAPITLPDFPLPNLAQVPAAPHLPAQPEATLMSDGGAFAAVPALPALVAPSLPDLSDDLGESFSAAKLGAEPPPRAGSVPVMLSPLGSTPVLAAAPLQSPPPLTPLGAFGSGSSQQPVPATPPDDGPAAPPAWPPVAVPVAELAPPPPPPAPPSWGAAPAPALPVAWAAEVKSPPVPTPPTGPLEDLTFGCSTDLRQLTLRAVLGTDQVLTPQDIVDRCAALPGLKSCLLLQPDATLTSQDMDPEEAAAFRASAAKTRDSLAVLAETMGLGSSGNFTLRTDHGIRSFFLEGNLCLAVRHAQPQFSGGTREKLILITQELAKS